MKQKLIFINIETYANKFCFVLFFFWNIIINKVKISVLKTKKNKNMLLLAHIYTFTSASAISDMHFV